MQSYTVISDATKINDWPEAITGNLGTIMSNSSGTSFPSTQKYDGRLAYRSDQEKLYALKDGTTDDWVLIADLTKTHITSETVASTYLAKASLTDSLTDGSSTKAATAAASKAIKDALDSHIQAYTTLTGAVTRASGTYTFTEEVLVSKNKPILKLKSGSTGLDTNEKAAAFLMGSTDTKSLTLTVKGDGTGYIGLGALDGSSQPSTKAIRIDAGQSGVYLYGTLTGASNGTFAGTLHSTGTLSSAAGITAAGDITAYSDSRIKENIALIPDALDKVLSLRGVYFTRTTDKRESLGVIAQELLEIEPRAVLEGDTEDDLMSVAYGNLTALLIEAVKELNKKVEANAVV